MKRISTILVCVLLSGCAARSPESPANKPIEARHYEPASAAALAFSPPVTPPYPLLGLDRSAREASAFIGYEDATIEYYSLGIADHQSQDPTQESYDRVSSSEKVGVRYR